jgi:hypothetical protein
MINMMLTAKRPSNTITIITELLEEAELIADTKFKAKRNAPIAAAMLRTKWKWPTTKYVS